MIEANFSRSVVVVSVRATRQTPSNAAPPAPVKGKVLAFKQNGLAEIGASYAALRRINGLETKSGLETLHTAGRGKVGVVVLVAGAKAYVW